MPAFTILDNETASIGDVRLRLHQAEPPLDGKWRYLLSTGGSDRHAPLQKLEAHQLRSICPADVPNGFSLSIYKPKSSFRELDFLEVHKFNDQSDITVTVSLDFADWHLPKNLRDFVDDYCTELKNKVESIVSASADQNEVGFSVSCTARVDPTTNFYAAYLKLSEQVLASYRHALAAVLEKSQPKVAATSMPTDAHGSRWWIRYVVVPILGSGAVAAAITAVLALLK